MTQGGFGASGGSGGGDRGQSETIGVLLAVVLVIVLVAAIAQFVFGLDIVQSGEQDIGPRVSFGTTTPGDEFVIEHRGGETVLTREITVVGSDTGTFGVDWGAQGIGEEWTSGESLTLTPQDGETIRIVWESAKTDDSTVLLKYRYTG